MPRHNFKNRIGERYGHLLVIEQAPNIITPNGRSHVAWKCLCDCGNEKIIRSDLLQNGSTKSCGCKAHGQRVIDETGNKYGKLTVLKRVGSDQDKKALWLCKCECGNTTITTGKRLRIGIVQSCGCIKSIKESEISKLLYKNNINFKREYHFSNLKDIQPLRFCLFIFCYSSDLAFNTIFYSTQNISERYHYQGKNVFIFSLINNLIILTQLFT